MQAKRQHAKTLSKTQSNTSGGEDCDKTPTRDNDALDGEGRSHVEEDVAEKGVDTK